MSTKSITSVIQHIKATSYVDDQIDKFDAFGITWNGDEAIHVTFGRNTINIRNTRFYVEDGISGVESGEVDVLRLDVAGLTMPLDTAKELAETLLRMIALAEKRKFARMNDDV